MTSIPSNAQLIYHSRRGMLELDLILSNFLNKHLDTLTTDMRIDYAHLLTHADPDLFNWLMGYSVTCDPMCTNIIAKIREV